MVAYFDTSALVPLLIDEPSTARCTQTWDSHPIVASSTLAFVEVHAALAQAARGRRLDDLAHRRAINDFATVWNDMLHIPVGDAVIRRAAALTLPHALRGYDAVHCATALAVASDDFVAVSGDRDLLRAWSELGITTIDTTG